MNGRHNTLNEIIIGVIAIYLMISELSLSSCDRIICEGLKPDLTHL
jgi:hypothetical protein